MSKHRQAARVDDNQAEIVNQLRAIPGVTAAPGHDDLFIGYRGFNYWIELKNPNVISPRTRRPRPSAIKKSQKDIRATWQGQYDICWTIEQIIEIIGIVA